MIHVLLPCPREDGGILGDGRAKSRTVLRCCAAQSRPAFLNSELFFLLFSAVREGDVPSGESCGFFLSLLQKREEPEGHSTASVPRRALPSLF